MDINLLTTVLKAEADFFRKRYDDAIKEKEVALENAKNNFIGNALAKENERIENEFNAKIIDYKAECAKCFEDIETLRTQEREKVKNFDRSAVERAKALQDLPLTEDEFIALMDDEKMVRDYMSRKILINTAEKNGIDVIKTGLGADYSTKLDVLGQLEEQLTHIIENYPSGNDDEAEALKCRRVYLSEDIINRAIEIYGGTADLKTDEQKADEAWLHIKSKYGDMERAFAIRNTMGNIKDESVRNRLLYNIATDKNLSDISLQMSGRYDEIIDFRKNSAKDYKKAVEAMERVRKATEKEGIELVLSENSENPFFESMYQSETNKNEFLRGFMNPEE